MSKISHKGKKRKKQESNCNPALLYEQYVNDYKYPPSQASHLTAFAKKKGKILIHKDAAFIIKHPPTKNESPPKPLPSTDNTKNIETVSITPIKSAPNKLKKYDENDIDEKTIRDVLDDVEHKEIKHKTTVDDWIPINLALRSGDGDYIKQLILDGEIDINADRDPSYNATVLHKAALYGNLELVSSLLNMGADIKPRQKDGKNAFEIAKAFGNFHVAEAIIIHSLGASLGTSVKQHIDVMQRQDGFVANSLKYLDENAQKQIVNLIINCIKECAPFSDDELILSWAITCRDKECDAIQSELFKTMMNVFEDIICDTAQKVEWSWLKHYFLKSTLWFRDHPNVIKNDDHEDKKEDKDKDKDDEIEEFNVEGTMFVEILERVKKESLRQANKHLSVIIAGIQENFKEDWIKLTTLHHQSSRYKLSRQDSIPYGLQPSFSERELIEFTSDIDFNPRSYSDVHLYLDQLTMRANYVNEIFQHDMDQLIYDIKKENDLVSDNKIEVMYFRGPVKKQQRAKSKVEIDYFGMSYPTSAHLLDINRCTLEFAEIDDLVNFVERFVQKIDKKDNKSCIKGIVRCKNMWKEWKDELPSYSDIKFNVHIEKNNVSIIGEIQLTLDFMSKFKKGAHALYGIQRHDEYVANLKKLKPLLMDKERQLYVLANNGDYNGLCYYMVTNQMNPNELIEYKDENDINILVAICKRDRVRAFNMLRKLVDEDVFSSALGEYTKNNWNAVGWALNSKSMQIIDILQRNYPQYILHYKGNNNRTAVIFAAENSNIQLLRWVFDEIDSRFDEDAYDKRLEYLHQTQIQGWSLLTICCRYNNVEGFNYLLSLFKTDEERAKFINHSVPQQGFKSFMACCSAGTYHLLDDLLNKYLKSFDKLKDEFIFATKKDGRTAGHYCSWKARTKIAKLLLDSLSSDEQRLKWLNHRDNTDDHHNIYERAIHFKHQQFAETVKQWQQEYERKVNQSDNSTEWQIV